MTPIHLGSGFLSNTALLLWFTDLTSDSTLIRTLNPPCHCFGIYHTHCFLFLLHFTSSSPQLVVLFAPSSLYTFHGQDLHRFCLHSLESGFPSIQGTFPIPLLCAYLFIGQYHLYNTAHHIETFYAAMYKLPRANAIIHTRICSFSHCCLLATSDMCGCSYFG
jgi:hypothetical protein